MGEITVESTDNGWIVRSVSFGGCVEVFIDVNEMLNAVYRKVSCEWHVGDRVFIERDGKRLKEG